MNSSCPQTSRMHDVFHVSQLRRCFKDPIRGVDHEVLDIKEDLTYREHPVRILGEAERKTRNKAIKSSKFNGVTILKKKQPGNEKLVFDGNIPPSSLKPRISGRDSCKGGRFVTAPVWY